MYGLTLLTFDRGRGGVVLNGKCLCLIAVQVVLEDRPH